MFHKLFYSLVLVFALSSCASYDTGFIADNVNLSNDNFTYIERNVRGQASTSYIFFYLIGGKNKSNMVEEAKQQILNTYPLTGNQSLANINVYWDTDMIALGLYAKSRCIVTADIVEFQSTEGNSVE